MPNVSILSHCSAENKKIIQIMTITFLLNGKTEDDYIKKGIEIFESRLKHFIAYKTELIPALKNTKNMPVSQQKEKEAELMLKHIEKADFVVLLDEKGKEYTSQEFSDFLQQKMNSSVRNLLFIVGGPYGFSPNIYALANSKLSLSKMTFSHQMIRLLFVEQLYRGFSIINSLPYHNI